MFDFHLVAAGRCGQLCSHDDVTPKYSLIFLRSLAHGAGMDFLRNRRACSVRSRLELGSSSGSWSPRDRESCSVITNLKSETCYVVYTVARARGEVRSHPGHHSHVAGPTWGPRGSWGITECGLPPGGDITPQRPGGSPQVVGRSVTLTLCSPCLLYTSPSPRDS